MKQLPPIAALVLALSLPVPAAQAQQSVLRFTNADDPATPAADTLRIRLKDNTDLNVLSNGDVDAQCYVVDGATTCADLPAGGGGTGPTPTFATSLPPAGTQPYPVPFGFQLALQPTSVQTADVCVFSTTTSQTLAGAEQEVTNTGWSGARLRDAADDPVAVSLPEPNRFYRFKARCYNSAGAGSLLSSPPLQTADTPPPAGCAVNPPPIPPAGYTRRAQPSQLSELELYEFGTTGATFPTMAPHANFLSSPTEYLSVALTMPAVGEPWNSNGSFVWLSSQTAASPLGNVYVKISTCPNDFRFPTTSASIDDPTNAPGCTNFRPDAAGGGFLIRSNINYAVDEAGNATSTETTCRLRRNTTYYINVIRADPRDSTIGPNGSDAACAGPITFCGIMMRWTNG